MAIFDEELTARGVTPDFDSAEEIRRRAAQARAADPTPKTLATEPKPSPISEPAKSLASEPIKPASQTVANPPKPEGTGYSTGKAAGRLARRLLRGVGGIAGLAEAGEGIVDMYTNGPSLDSALRTGIGIASTYNPYARSIATGMAASHLLPDEVNKNLARGASWLYEKMGGTPFAKEGAASGAAMTPEFERAVKEAGGPARYAKKVATAAAPSPATAPSPGMQNPSTPESAARFGDRSYTTQGLTQLAGRNAGVNFGLTPEKINETLLRKKAEEEAFINERAAAADLAAAKADALYDPHGFRITPGTPTQSDIVKLSRGAAPFITNRSALPSAGTPPAIGTAALGAARDLETAALERQKLQGDIQSAGIARQTARGQLEAQQQVGELRNRILAEKDLNKRVGLVGQLQALTGKVGEAKDDYVIIPGGEYTSPDGLTKLREPSRLFNARTGQEVPLGEGGKKKPKPTLQQFMEAARKDPRNANVSDGDLKKFYEGEYG